MRPSLDQLSTVVLVACAAAMVGMAARRQFSKPASAVTDRTVPGWRQLAATGHRAGPPAAAVTMIEFSDYQCPSCERLRFAIDTVLANHPTDVALVYRHYPLRLTHAYS